MQSCNDQRTGAYLITWGHGAGTAEPGREKVVGDNINVYQQQTEGTKKSESNFSIVLSDRQDKQQWQ